MKLVFLSGGTGTPKLIQGFLSFVKQEDITVVGNTGEDLEMSGLYISPDLDTLLYTFAGIVNEETWYGIKGDTFHEHEKRRAEGEFLKIGDLDRRYKQMRTDLLRSGMTLSQATRILCETLGVRAKLLPMSDQRVTTRILTPKGEMSFHEFWILEKGKVEVTGVKYSGAENAEPAPDVIEELESADWIIVGPSNPVTSIGPILSVRKIREKLEKLRKKTIAVSPIIGEAPVSGPAGTLLKGLGFEVSPYGVARFYQGLISAIFVDYSDQQYAEKIWQLGISVQFSSLLMRTHEEKEKLARSILLFLNDQVKDPDNN